MVLVQRLFLTLITAFICNLSFAQVTGIEPPNWYIMPNKDTMQLLVYGKNIRNATIKTTSNVFKINSVYSLPNPNYLLVNLAVPANAQPENFELIFTVNKRIQKFPYQIQFLPKRKRGIDQSDVLYLIMPDRFANGDSKNDIVDSYHQKQIDRNALFERHGGDLQGIMNNLNYLANLGITGLWLNPVVENNQPKESYHGYAVTNHYQIDKRLGTNKLYKALIDSMHNRNMKMIMDVVHNHVGDKHHFYTDIPDSAWFNWHKSFTRTTYRETVLFDPYAAKADQDLFVKGWFDKHMPDLNQKNVALAQYLIQNHIWWVANFDIDAIRIDTYAYPDQPFMANWGKALQEAFPDLSLFAETWVHGPAIQAWFTENNKLNKAYNNWMPAVTDFQLHYAINDLFTKQPGWTDGILRLYYTLAQDFLYANPNKHVIFLDNHDVSRFKSIVGDDNHKVKAGLMLLFSLRGIPCLYYGTEVGMKNFADPDGKVRLDFAGGWPADSINFFENKGRVGEAKELFDFTQNLIKLRKENPEIATGKFNHYIPKNGVYVFWRTLGKKQFVCVMNASDKKQQVNWSDFPDIQIQSNQPKLLIGNRQTTVGNQFDVEPYDCLWISVN